MTAPDHKRLQAFLRATASSGREVLRAGPFTAYLDRGDPLKYLNYAIPDDRAQPGRAAVEALRTSFRDRQRLPRLEWVEEAAPRLTASLASCGMVEELRAPLMVCGPDDLVDVRAGVGDLVVSAVGDQDLRECADLQRVAFGQAPLADTEDAPDPRAGGGGAVLARASAEAVAAANWTPISDGVSEIAGVATAAAWRGRGLAGAVTAAAARGAFAAGACVCVLSPGNETAERVYARAGFSRAATILHWSDPQPATGRPPGCRRPDARRG